MPSSGYSSRAGWPTNNHPHSHLQTVWNLSLGSCACLWTVGGAKVPCTEPTDRQRESLQTPHGRETCTCGLLAMEATAHNCCVAIRHILCANEVQTKRYGVCIPCTSMKSGCSFFHPEPLKHCFIFYSGWLE